MRCSSVISAGSCLSTRQPARWTEVSMKYQEAHEKLFDRHGLNSLQGALAALRRPVPVQNDYPNDAAREYAEIAMKNLRQIAGMSNSWPPFILQGLRLLVLERIFESRRLQ